MTFDESLQPLTPKQRSFLSAYVLCSSITSAAAATKLSRTVHYTWLSESENYATSYALAQPIAAQNIEDEAIKRATVGWDEPVFYKGDVCGTIRKFSDSLLVLLLKGHKPEKYKDRTDTTLMNPDGTGLFNKFEVAFLDRKNRES